MPITFAILGVLAILLFSYRQTIKAYPSAGGAYIVTKDNFGLLAAQLAGDTAAVVQRGQEQGWLLNNTGPDRLRFAPPLTLTEADVAAFVAAWPAIVADPGDA